MSRLLARTCATALCAPVAALALALAAAAPAPAAPGEAQPASSQVHLLYVLQAREGWTLHRPDGHWRLELAGVSPRMLAFSDRPQRVSSQIPTRAFVVSWRRLFAGNPPNAAMIVANGPREAAPTAVELFKARWRGRRLELCMCKAGDENLAWLKRMTRRSARRHGAITLFLDDAATGTVYTAPTAPVNYSYPIAGDEEVMLETWGAGAAGSGGARGAPASAGGMASGMFAVTRGETLEISVGVPGSPGAGGAPEGGAGAFSTSPGSRVCQAGGGGGATRVSLRPAGGGTPRPLLVAAGGGGYSLVANVYAPPGEEPPNGYPCSVDWAVAGGDGGGLRIGGSPPGAGAGAGAASIAPECVILTCGASQQWALGGGGGGGGGSAGSAWTFAQSTTTGGGGGTNWIANGVSLAQGGTASAADQHGFAMIMPMG